MDDGGAEVKRQGRRSRVETAALTRRHLLEAAGGVFANVGYQAATIERIVERAGYTRGAFYAHFSDKADVFVTLLEDSREDDLARIRTLLQSTSAAHTQATVQDWYDDLAAHNRWELAYAELWPQATRTPALRARLAARQERVRAAIGSMIGAHCEQEGLVLPMPVAEVAGLMLALADGIAAQRHLDTQALPTDAFITATMLLWAGLLADPAQGVPGEQG